MERIRERGGGEEGKKGARNNYEDNCEFEDPLT